MLPQKKHLLITGVFCYHKVMENEKRDIHLNFLHPIEKRFIVDKFTAIVDIEPPTEIDSRIQGEAKALGMHQKNDFHITVIGNKNGRAIKELPDGPGMETYLAEKFNNTDWNYLLLPEYYQIQKFYGREALSKSGYSEEVPEHNRYTIIQKIILPDLEKFYMDLNERTGLNLPVPVPHITLFSGAEYEPLAQRGIGVDTEVDFKKYLQRSL